MYATILVSMSTDSSTVTSYEPINSDAKSEAMHLFRKATVRAANDLPVLPASSCVLAVIRKPRARDVRSLARSVLEVTEHHYPNHLLD